MTIAEMAGEIRSGMVIGVGGWGSRRKPMALVRALVRSGVGDLTVVSYGGMDVGMLCASGQVKRLIFGFVSLDVVALDPHFRAARQRTAGRQAARQQGEIEFIEFDEGMLQWGLKAAAANLPFLPTRVGLGSDIERLNPELKRIKSPYGGEELLAMPALKLDIALLHVNVADRRGHNFVFGADPYFDAWMSRAAARTFISCEDVVEEVRLADMRDLQAQLVPRFLIDGVAAVRFGAHPTSCPPDYGMDGDHIRAYAQGAADWQDYRRRYIDCEAHADYIAAIGGADQIRRWRHRPL